MPIRLAVARVAAVLSALSLVVGAGAFGRAVVATQGWWYSGFVSETGEPGAPHRAGYTYGILGLAAALLLLAFALVLRGVVLRGVVLRGAALRGGPPARNRATGDRVASGWRVPDRSASNRSLSAGVASGVLEQIHTGWAGSEWLGRWVASGWAVWSAAGLLAVGGLLAGVSSLVSCSPGCPLPPYQAPTAADLVHASSSVLGLAACGAAMLVFALGPPGGLLRSVSRGWLVVVVPLAAAAGLSLVLLGRGYTTGSVEKVLVVVVIGWVLAASVLVARADT